MGSVGSVYEPKKLIMNFKQMQLDMCKYIMYMQMQTIQMYQIIYIYSFFLFDKQLNVFLSTEKKDKVLAFNKSKNKMIHFAYSTC